MDDLFDLAVIGGGVNGAGIARDAAGRGAKVLLLEAGDLAGRTSSASTKLIHGGLRYLEHYEFALVREALGERERLWRIAPHIVRPMRFVLPHVEGLRPVWMLRLGLWLYDHIGGRKLLPKTRTVRLAKHEAGSPLSNDHATGFEYSDCWVDDARLVVLNAMDAAEHGARVLTRTPMSAARRENDHWLIETSAGQFRASAMVNAGGPAVLEVLGRIGEPADYAMRLVRGSHIVVPKLFDHAYAYIFQLPDGRVCFAIPYERDFTLIGTTDAEHEGTLDRVGASREEIEYLCEAANRYFARTISPADVVWSYAGVRPLVDDGSGKPEEATRGYRLDLTEKGEGAPLLSVYGGKITTYRKLAESALETIDTAFGRTTEGWTHAAPLAGGDFAVADRSRLLGDLQALLPFMDAATVRRLFRQYGTECLAIFAGASGWDDLGGEIAPGVSARELDWAAENEWVHCAEDFVWRRSKLGLRLSAKDLAAIDRHLSSRVPALKSA